MHNIEESLVLENHVLSTRLYFRKSSIKINRMKCLFILAKSRLLLLKNSGSAFPVLEPQAVALAVRIKLNQLNQLCSYEVRDVESLYQ